MPVIKYIAYKLSDKNCRENREREGVWSRGGDGGVIKSVLDGVQGKPH